MPSQYSISNDILNQLVGELKEEYVTGIILAGSHARKEPTPYSDVDIVRFTTTMPFTEKERYTLKYVEKYLVSVSTTTIEKKKEEMTKPERAI
jgi:predicted nucleotidyltransferase